MHVESNFPEAGTRSQSGEVGTGGKDGARGISNSGKTQIISRYLLQGGETPRLSPIGRPQRGPLRTEGTHVTE